MASSVASVVIAVFLSALVPPSTAFFGTSLRAKNIPHSWNKYDKEYSSASMTSLLAAPVLLADPMPNSIGNFFENKTDDMSFIQCYMLSVGVVDGLQYGKMCTISYYYLRLSHYIT